MERARGAVEELEGLERGVAAALARKKRAGGRLGRLNEDFKVAKLLRETAAAARDAAAWRERGQNVEEEVARIKSEDMQGFFMEKRALQEFYTRHPNAKGQVDVLEVCAARAAEAPQWSGEERHGKYLDLHALFHTFTNLKGADSLGKNISYTEYLGRLANFADIDILKVKAHRPYLEYLKALHAYLDGFHRRAQALVFLDLDAVAARFEDAWREGRVAGWERTQLQSDAEVAALDAPKVMRELLVRGAKSGGSPPQRVERLNLIREHPLHLGPAESARPPSDAQDAKVWRKARLFDAYQVAREEALVQFLVENLADFVDATVSFITRKQTQTYEELRQEEEAEAKRELGDDDDEDALYVDAADNDLDNDRNPQNLPLDWDGKPIPLWLYKLHGLNVEYTCEICGNHIYRGRHAYERHFRDWRHAHGMSVLGIPNTAHFHEISKIDEARALYAKLRSSIEQDTFSRDQEQLEDSEGNVLDRKTYLDLKRQGLI
ncbi:Splicing factor 3A subunit 3 [Hondaea fermentalgiana]|uniref:Splicing factor 3A subunit 3 n=1 Tax=Hondaea fermentalgiana TaxID=2315210 RepID=A0A2R5G3V9_9STRA|nr:Splicing factor 3A subunit 3 [Hondaea fermentalgiana]|eukprot:GBG25702.1 Splicing factor 3A subunit 3 [Hondaea fermentalgiana]